MKTRRGGFGFKWQKILCFPLSDMPRACGAVICPVSFFKMKGTIINNWVVSAERGRNSGSSNLGFIAGQSFGAAVEGYPNGDHTLWSGVWESGNVTGDKMALTRRIQAVWVQTEQGLRMEGWRGSQDLITSAGRRQIAGQCFEGLRKAKCGCSCVPEGTKLAVL